MFVIGHELLCIKYLSLIEAVLKLSFYAIFKQGFHLFFLLETGRTVASECEDGNYCGQ